MIPYHTQVKTEDGITYAKTVFQDDKALEKVARLRHENVLDKGKLGVHDDADLRMVFSCPSLVMWNFFKRDHPQTYKLMNSTSEDDRMKGSKQLQILHPEWCVYTRV